MRINIFTLLLLCSFLRQNLIASLFDSTMGDAPAVNIAEVQLPKKVSATIRKPQDSFVTAAARQTFSVCQQCILPSTYFPEKPEDAINFGKCIGLSVKVGIGLIAAGTTGVAVGVAVGLAVDPIGTWMNEFATNAALDFVATRELFIETYLQQNPHNTRENALTELDKSYRTTKPLLAIISDEIGAIKLDFDDYPIMREITNFETQISEYLDANPGSSRQEVLIKLDREALIQRGNNPLTKLFYGEVLGISLEEDNSELLDDTRRKFEQQQRAKKTEGEQKQRQQQIKNTSFLHKEVSSQLAKDQRSVAERIEVLKSQLSQAKSSSEKNIETIRELEQTVKTKQLQIEKMERELPAQIQSEALNRTKLNEKRLALDALVQRVNNVRADSDAFKTVVNKDQFKSMAELNNLKHDLGKKQQELADSVNDLNIFFGEKQDRYQQALNMLVAQMMFSASMASAQASAQMARNNMESLSNYSAGLNASIQNSAQQASATAKLQLADIGTIPAIVMPPPAPNYDLKLVIPPQMMNEGGAGPKERPRLSNDVIIKMPPKL